MRTLIGSFIALTTLTLVTSTAAAAEPGVGPVADDTPGVPADTGAEEEAAPTTRSAKNSLYLELLGNGGVYSVNYERNITDEITLRLGFSQISVSTTINDETDKASLMTFPLMANYLLGGGNHHLELGAGATLVYASGELNSGGDRFKGEGFAASGTATVGYRYQPRDGGFFFKVGATPFVNSRGVFPWGGLSLGGVF